MCLATAVLLEPLIWMSSPLRGRISRSLLPRFDASALPSDRPHMPPTGKRNADDSACLLVPGPLQLPVEHLDDRVDDSTCQLLRVHSMPFGKRVPDRLNQGLVFVMPLLQQVKQIPLRIVIHGGDLAT
jgi:hypothetical protein